MRFTEISEGSPEDRFKKYIRPVVKTTPKIERTTNPSGRSTDHVEWKVTTPTGEIHRYNSKKQAQEHFDSFGEQDVSEGSRGGFTLDDLGVEISYKMKKANGKFQQRSIVCNKEEVSSLMKELKSNPDITDVKRVPGVNESVAEGYNFKGSFPFDVDHMGGTRGINLPSAPTKKYFTDKKQWMQTVDDINSSKYDDNSEYSGITGRTTVSIDDREWARWSDAQEKGYIEMSSMTEGENWSKHNNKRVGGMSKKSVSSYRRSHPGSKIQTAVTTKPSKLKKGSKAAARRKSFCARMRGMKKHRTGAKTARDPNSNINKSLRRWHCESIEELQELVMIAEQFIRNKKNEL